MTVNDQTYELYASGTAHGNKVMIMLEECGAPYRYTFVNLAAREHQTPEFLALNPEGKTPVLVDPDGPGGRVVLSQSLAIVSYLADKTGKFLPQTAGERLEAQRYMAQVSSDIAGAFAGLFIFSRVFGQPDGETATYFAAQARRHLKVMDDRLANSPYLAGETYTLADVLAAPVAFQSVAILPEGVDGYPNIARWTARLAERPAVRRVFKLDAAA